MMITVPREDHVDQGWLVGPEHACAHAGLLKKSDNMAWWTGCKSLRLERFHREEHARISLDLRVQEESCEEVSRDVFGRVLPTRRMSTNSSKGLQELAEGVAYKKSSHFDSVKSSV